MTDPNLKDIERRMKGALGVLLKEFSGLRTGRASASLLEPLSIEAYGSQMPLNQVASISVPESRMLSVQVWDKTHVQAVERAIMESGLGLNPQTEGQFIRVPIPELSEERRIELGKVASKYAEQARVAIRNVRRDGMDKLKHKEKDGEISKDEHHAWSEDVQKLTDDYVKKIDEAVHEKEHEILQV